MVSTLEENSAKETLLKFLDSIHSMSPELRDALFLNTYLQKVNKKHILLNIDEIQKSLFFVVKGLVRSYYLDSFG